MEGARQRANSAESQNGDCRAGCHPQQQSVHTGNDAALVAFLASRIKMVSSKDCHADIEEIC